MQRRIVKIQFILASLAALTWVGVAAAQPTRIKLYDGKGGPECDVDGLDTGTQNAGPGNEMHAIDYIQVGGKNIAFVVGMSSDVQNPNAGEGPWQGRAYSIELAASGPTLLSTRQISNATKGNQPFNKPAVECIQEKGVCLVSDGNDEENGSNVSTYVRVVDPITLQVLSGPTLVSESNDNDNEGASDIEMIRKDGDGYLFLVGYNDNGTTGALVPFRLNADNTITRGRSNANDIDYDFVNATICRPYIERINDAQAYVGCRNGNRSNNGAQDGGVRVYKVTLNGLNDLPQNAPRAQVCQSADRKYCSDGEIAIAPDGKIVVMAGSSGGPINNPDGSKNRNDKGPSMSGLYVLGSDMNKIASVQSIGPTSDQTHPVFAGLGVCPDGVSTCAAVGTTGRSDSADGKLNLMKINPDGTLSAVGILPVGGKVAGGKLSNQCGGNPNNQGREIGHALYIANPNYNVPGALYSDSVGLWLWPHAGVDSNPAFKKNAAWLSVMPASGSATGLLPPEGALVGAVPDPGPGALGSGAGGDSSSGSACSVSHTSSGSAAAWMLLAFLGLVVARVRRERK